MLLLPPIESLPREYWFIYLLVTVFASGTVGTICGILITALIYRKRTSAETHEFRARTDLTTVQTTKTLAETLRVVTEQLQESYDLAEHQQAWIKLLEEQVARAQAKGYLDELEAGSKTRSAGGTGNPAALPPAS